MRYESFFSPIRMQRWAPLVATAVILCVVAAPLLAKPGKGGGQPDQGTTDPATQTTQRIKWRVPLAGSYSNVRPAVAADGTVYVVDVTNNLYAVSPVAASFDHEPSWVAPDAGRKGVSVAEDENGAGHTVYTGNEDWIKAFTPDGSLKWEYVQNPRAFVLPAVSVGPDGNIYAIATSGMGVFSLEDMGDHASLRWQTAEIYARNMVSYTELAFGPTQDGSGGQLYFFANAHIRAIDLEGISIFTTSGVATPVVSPLDGTWHQDNTAHDPDGTLFWEFQLPDALAGTVPALDLDGNHYTVVGGYQLFAIDPTGAEIFHTALDENVGPPDVDPTGAMLLMPTGASSTQQAAVKAVSTTNGRELWRTELPPSDNGANQYIDTGFAFSPNGDTAYVIAAILASDATQSGSYLYAIATDASIPTVSTVLRSADITLSAQTKGRKGIVVSGAVTVEDENQTPISGATVEAVWTLPDGTKTDPVSSDSGGGGIANFSISGAGPGIYWLTVRDIAKDAYTFDLQNSQLSAAIAAF